jgi:hypothetical protein
VSRPHRLAGFIRHHDVEQGVIGLPDRVRLGSLAAMQELETVRVGADGIRNELLKTERVIDDLAPSA